MKTIVVTELGECVHMAGVLKVLNLTEKVDGETFFLVLAILVETMQSIYIR